MQRMSAVFAAAGVACAGLGVMLPSSAHAQGQGPQGCYGFGRLTLSPGVTASPSQGRFQMAQNLGPCRLPDTSILSGTLTGDGDGSLSCVAGQGAGRFTIRWENGRTSLGTFSFGTSGPHIFGSGSITQGEFAGDRFGISGEIEPRHTEDCASGGVKEATSYEAIGVSPG
ncbi:MAG TPA: hypothetical protein VH134_05320 [Candidatus Dormibacteraeota bacterium]|nr:hypothetical protein [Candidatus Dormibacteraeota bacterium]